MDTYKDINRELTLKNQELRQEVAQYRNEIVTLKRKLMTEKQKVQIFNRLYICLVAEMSKLCNNAMKEFNQVIEDLIPDNNEASLLENIQNKSLSRKSARQLSTTLRRVQDVDYDKENRAPLADDVVYVQESYVQTRRRRNDSNSDTQVECNPQPYVETINSSASLECSKDTEKTITDSPGSVPRNIHTIQEENTSDLSQFLPTVQGVSIQSLSHSSIVEESRLEPLIIFPEKRHPPINSHLQLASVIVTDEHQDQISQQQTQANSSEPHTLIEDTIFDNFRALKAVCSTPHKPSDSKNIKKCVVKIKRLTCTDLKRLGNATSKNKALSQQNERKNRRKNISPIPFKRISSPRISTQRTLIERFSERENETSVLRPKRSAAPITLKEPSINRKLRRDL